MDGQLEESFAREVEADEIEAAAGKYSIGLVPGTTWKALVLIGAITTPVGFVLVLMAQGWIYPVPDYLPTPLGSALFLTVLVAGLLILVAGLALRRKEQIDPPIEPIV